MEMNLMQRSFLLPALRLVAVFAVAVLMVSAGWAQDSSSTPSAPSAQMQAQKAVPSASQPFEVKEYSQPRSHFANPLAPYTPRNVAPPNLANTARIDQLLRDGKLYLSMNDAVALALENNLDIAIARYNLNIADTDIWRAKAGSATLGVNTGVVQGTPGGTGAGVGTTSTGGGAGGTTAGTGGAGTGTAGLVSSTLGVGSAVPSFDPVLTGTLQFDRNHSIGSNAFTTTSEGNTTLANFSYQQGFQWGTNLTVGFNNTRATTNSPFSIYSPQVSSNFRATFSQPLLSGFGFAPNTRFIRIAKNNREISDVAFRLQIITTVDQIENLYWNLVFAYENVRVANESLTFAQKTLSDNKKQVEIGSLAPIEVVRAQSTVATDQQQVTPTQDLVGDALSHRAELAEARINLTNQEISMKAVRSSLLPSLDLFGYYGGTGIGGDVFLPTCPPNPPPFSSCFTPSRAAPPFRNGGPVSYGDTLNQLVTSSAPDKGVGLTLSIPIRNRVAQSTQVRSELEYRQAQMRLQQTENQVRIEVLNAQFSVTQNRAAVEAAQAAVELGHQSLDAEQKKYALGASTATLVLQNQSTLAQAESTLVSAMAAYEKSRTELDRATGLLLDHAGILLADAERGQVTHMPNVPYIAPRPDAQSVMPPAQPTPQPQTPPQTEQPQNPPQGSGAR